MVLSHTLAQTYASAIVESLDRIPLVDPHSVEQVLAETKGDRLLHHKWDHSMIALTQSGQYVGVILSYEREAEDELRYPRPSIYLSSLAVDTNFQGRGVAKSMIATWLEHNRVRSFLDLEGDLEFTVQTNSAEWNVHVQRLYTSFGFTPRATKSYGNRVDTVYSLKPTSC